MTDSCPPIDELLALDEETTRDPRVAHVQACPRCRSLLAAARGFASRELGEACPGEGAAVPRIQAVLRERILGAEPAAEPAAARPGNRPIAPPPASSPAGRVGLARFLSLAVGPRFLIPVFGAAAVLVGGFLLVRNDLPWSSEPPTLREGPGASSSVNLATLPPRALAGGEIELSWRRSASANAYRVRLFDAEMREIGSLSAGAETLLVVPASKSGGPAAPVFWQVEALSQGDKIGDSVPLRWSSAPGR